MNPDEKVSASTKQREDICCQEKKKSPEEAGGDRNMVIINYFPRLAAVETQCTKTTMTITKWRTGSQESPVL